MILCLVIFVLTIASFLWGKISMGLTALLSMVLLVLTGCIDITTALSGFSNSNTIIMACMFIISAGFSKTQMVAKLSRGVAKAAKGSFTRVLTGYIIVTLLIAQIVPSAMAVFSIVFPLALGVCDEMKVSPSKIMFSIGIVAISTVTALPIGAGAVYPAQYNGLLENLGAGVFQFKFWDVGLARLPGVIAVMLYAILLAPKFAPEKPVIETREVKPVGTAGAVKLSPVQEVVGYLVFFGVILGLIVTSLQLIKIPVIGEDGTTTLMKLDTCVFPLIGALLMVAFGILKPKEAYVSIGMGGMVLRRRSRAGQRPDQHRHGCAHRQCHRLALRSERQRLSDRPRVLPCSVRADAVHDELGGTQYVRAHRHSDLHGHRCEPHRAAGPGRDRRADRIHDPAGHAVRRHVHGYRRV